MLCVQTSQRQPLEPDESGIQAGLVPPHAMMCRAGAAEKQEERVGGDSGAAQLPPCGAVQPDHRGAAACRGHRGPLLPLCLPPTPV